MRNLVIAASSLLILLSLSCLIAIVAQSQSPYRVNGDLRDGTGVAFAGATVCALQTDGKVVNVRDRICTESDAQGKFVINLTQSGRYQIVAEQMSDGYMPPYYRFYKDPQTPIPEVNLTEDKPAASISVTIGPKSGLITGTVKDEATDLPVQNYVVWIWQARDPNARTHEVVKNSTLGHFRILAPPVSFTFRVVAEGYEDWGMGGGVLTSLAGSRKGPGSLLVRGGSTANFAVYLKRKNPSAIGPGPGDAERLPAPVQLNPPDNQTLDVFPRTTRLEWNPVAGATSYAVEIEACWNRLPVVRERLPDDGECINPAPFEQKFGLRQTAYEFVFMGAQPGRWRAWAIDKDRRPGVKSPWRRFIHTK